MKQTNIWQYIWIGTCLRYLQDQQIGCAVHLQGKTLDNIAFFLTALDELNLHVIRRAAGKLVIIQEELKAKPPNYRLTKDEAQRLSESASEIRHTFVAETR